MIHVPNRLHSFPPIPHLFPSLLHTFIFPPPSTLPPLQQTNKHTNTHKLFYLSLLLPFFLSSQTQLKKKEIIKISIYSFLTEGVGGYHQKLPHPANKNPVPKDSLKARCSCSADRIFIPLTYFCILAVGMMFIPLDAAN